MYLDHFGLIEFPFRITPDPAFLFWTADHYRAFDLLTRAVRGDRPVTTILGDPGTGKTTLLQHFVAGLPRGMQLGMISNYSSGLGGLGQWLHRAFALRPEAPEAELLAAFKAYLVARHRDGARCLLIVDEAQNVSDDDFAELTDLTRLAGGGGPAMQLVLAGQPRLRRRLPAPTNRNATGGSVPFEIGRMSREDVAGYIRHRMAMAGCLDPVFDDAVTGRIARLTGGVPRLVNVLCELLLTAAFGAGERRIDTALVDRVLQEVQQTGMLDHLLAVTGGPALRAAMPISVRAALPPAHRTTMASRPPPPPAPEPEPAALRVVAEIEALPVPANLQTPPAPPPCPVAMPTQAAAPDRSHNRRTGPALVAAGTAAAAVALAIALAVLSDRSSFAPVPSVAALQQEDAAPVAPLPVSVGPALPAPSGLQGTDVAALLDRALIVGTRDPLAAAIGFARAGLRGDARAAYYLGQLFEAGDGVPRNAALAAAWYASAAETQRSARRALQNLTGTAAATDPTPAAPPRPLMGILGADRRAEFVWAAPDGAAARYLIELSEAPGAPPRQYGPFDLSAALLDPAISARVWRVVSLDVEGAWTGASGWHLIASPGSGAPSPAP